MTVKSFEINPTSALSSAGSISMPVAKTTNNRLNLKKNRGDMEVRAPDEL
jgi:hypothetical protein